MIIRRAEERDIAALLSIERECITPPWSEGLMLAELFNDDTLFLVAQDGAELIGFAVLRKSVDAAELFRIAVTATARRRGIGRRLLSEIIDTAESDGMRRFYLEVRALNAAAIALYKSFDFITVGHRRNYYDAPVEDAIVMKRGLEVIDREGTKC